jgi:hypothetical protein
MAKVFLTSINLSLNELQNAIIQNLATLPEGVKGQIAFNTENNKLSVFNGTAWETFEPSIAAGTTSQYWRGDKTWQTLNKAAVGLGNVDNTADSVKNVLSATKLTTARTIAISGGATGTATSFDGTKNITIPVTSLNAGSLTGTIPSSVLGNSTLYIGSTPIKLNQSSGTVTALDGLTRVQIGSVYLKYDSKNNALYVEKTDGTAVNFYATGEVSAYGAGSGTGGGGGVSALADLVDVSVTSPVLGDVMIFNGTHWENKPQSAIVPDLSNYATKTYVDNRVAALVDSAPETLDTLSELAEALGHDPNFATTIATQIGTKVTANDPITAGTATKITYDSKGLVTGGTSLSATDIPNLSASKITSGTLPVARGGTGVGTITGIIKGNGTSAFSAAVAGTDYVLPSGSITGNAGTATKLKTARTISISGIGLTGAATAFNGTANITIPLSGNLAIENGGTGLTDAKGGFVRKVVGTLTTSATSYTITHGLNSDVVAQVINITTNEVVECDIVMTDANKVTFGFNVAPAANAYRYIIVG